MGSSAQPQIEYLSLEYPVRLAHRGSRTLWPENTMTAFQGAIDLGYRYVETDVRVSRDGVVVVFHDETLDRTTNGTGRVADWTWDDLQTLDAGWTHGADDDFPFRGRGIRIPRLDDVYATFPGVHLNIDLKAARAEWAVADVVKRAGRESSTLVGSFIDRRLTKFRRITRGEIATGAGPADAVAMWTASRAGRTLRRPAVAYQLPPETGPMRVDRRMVEAIHRAGAHVHIWTINDPAEMRLLLDMGVDGIITDRPDLLNDVVRSRGGDV